MVEPSLHHVYCYVYSDFHLMAVFFRWTWFILGSSLSSCFRREPLGISGMRYFYGWGVLHATQPSVSKHWMQLRALTPVREDTHRSRLDPPSVDFWWKPQLVAATSRICTWFACHFIIFYMLLSTAADHMTRLTNWSVLWQTRVSWVWWCPGALSCWKTNNVSSNNADC